MELQGAKNCFAYLNNAGIIVNVFVSDRHKGIAKWIRETQPSTSHFFDIWHVVRSVNKKILQASKEKDCEVLAAWNRGIRNHIYWCATSTRPGFQEMILAKWLSFMRHVAGKHKDHASDLFKECAHGDIEPRNWIRVGMR